MIFLRLLADTLRHGYLGSSISIFPYVSEMDFDQFIHEEIGLRFPRCSSQLYVFTSDMLSLVNLDS